MLNLSQIKSQAIGLGQIAYGYVKHKKNELTETIKAIFQTVITALTNAYNNVRARFSKKTENTEMTEAPKATVIIETPAKESFVTKAKNNFIWAVQAPSRSLAGYVFSLALPR